MAIAWIRGPAYGRPVADRSHRGLIDLFWGREGKLTPERLADVLLMAVLADGRLTEGEADALSWTLAHRPELAGLAWDDLILRARELVEEAPLFSDLRARLTEELTDPADRRRALTLANRVAGAQGPLAEEEEALLRSLANAFEIGEAEQAELFRAPPPGSPRFTWRRSAYSDPTIPKPKPFFDLLADARDPGEARILLHRLHVIRAIWDTRFRDAKLGMLGHTVATDGHHIRIDAVFRHQARIVWIKALAPGESLYPRERQLWGTLLANKPRNTDLYLVYSGPMSPADIGTIDGHPNVERIELKL